MTTLTLVDTTPTRPADFNRDQWGRPLITPIDGGKPLPYTRSSTAAKTIEDTYNLELWARRNVMYGMTKDTSLVARVIALGGDPSTWDQATKKVANQIVDDAETVAAARKAADLGTAVHRMTELYDCGQPVDAGPWEDDITAYRNALDTAGLTVVEIECRLVCDELEMAGTADRILRNGTRHLIADIKTGETVDYGGLGWAAQLAAYAHSDLYDVPTGTRTPTPRLDQTTGIIIHLPAGQGVCTLYEIDLVAGYRAAELANEIRAVRKAARRWITPLTAPPVSTPEPVTGADTERRRNQLLERWRQLPAPRKQAFRDRHIDPDNLDAIETALDALEPRRVDPDLLENATAADLSTRVLALTPQQHTLINTLIAQASEAGGSISYKYEPHDRNVFVCRGLLSCCQADLTIDDIRTLIGTVIGGEVTGTPGAALVALTLAQAVDFDQYAAQAPDPTHTPTHTQETHTS